MRALVTGAGGFAGSHLVEHLLQRGDHVVALLAPQGSLERIQRFGSDVTVARADIRDAESLTSVLSNSRPEHIYHLASISTNVEFLNRPRLFHDVITAGTLNLLCAAWELRLECRMLFVSSAEVYGRVSSDYVMPLTETSPLCPDTPYGANKAAAELLARQFYRTYSLPVVCVRPFPHTGPHQSESFVCSGLAKQLAEIQAGRRRNRIAVGNLSTFRDFSDVRDIVRGYRLLLETGSAGEVYQLCSGCPVAISSILEHLVRAANIQIEIAVDASRIRRAECLASWGDNSAAKRACGWGPEIPLKETLEDLLTSWQAQM
jgi:GDP-4-dehydro-6-deoxy-D-mannose reductase